MTDLSTTYLGLRLKNPLVASASPLSKKIDKAKKLEEADTTVMAKCGRKARTLRSHRSDAMYSRL